MRAEMARKFYALQAHLYVVALHEYLRLRLPGYRYDEHFGGVRYVFLRGLDPVRPELGVYRDRPTAETIEALARSLSEAPASGPSRSAPSEVGPKAGTARIGAVTKAVKKDQPREP